MDGWRMSSGLTGGRDPTVRDVNHDVVVTGIGQAVLRYVGPVRIASF